MRLSNILTTSALLGSAMAAPAVHHQHQNKRDAVVTTTVHNQVTVVVNGAAPATEAATVNNVVPVDESAFLAASPAAQADTTTLAANNVATATTTTKAAAAAAQADTTTAEATTTTAASTAAASTSNTDTSSTVSAGGAKGITYSPYNADGTCKSSSDVASDLAKLSDYGIIRLYGVDCDQVSNVLQAKSSSQKLFLGVYYVDQIQSGVDTIASAISQYGSWDDVYTVSIGNELVNGGSASTSQVGEYISTGRSALTAAGYTGPVVSVDTFIAVINNPDLCQYSDYMAVNAHAYFDENTAAADAGTWVLQQIQRVWTACGGDKDVVITESGWPTQGQTYGKAVPSKSNQEAAISSIKSSCGDSTFLFTAFNDYWKADGAYGVEKYWGVYSD